MMFWLGKQIYNMSKFYDLGCSSVKVVMVEGVFEGLGFHDAGVFIRAMVEGVDTRGEAVLVDVFDQL